MFRGKVNELSALSELIKEGKGGAGGVNGSAISSWGVVDPEGLRNVFSVNRE